MSNQISSNFYHCIDIITPVSECSILHMSCCLLHLELQDLLHITPYDLFPLTLQGIVNQRRCPLVLFLTGTPSARDFVGGDLEDGGDNRYEDIWSLSLPQSKLTGLS